jgi:predicted RNA-binding Zn-ribbon protein involved in translation (DUF1610 family)
MTIANRYKIEVTRTVVVVQTFEVIAESEEAAHEAAIQMGTDTVWDMTKGSVEYSSEMEETPEDRGECPECNYTLRYREVTTSGDGYHFCPDCGWEEDH